MADWSPRVNELFLKAFELPDPAARRAFLDRECGREPDLLRAVETLLKAHDEAGGFLADPCSATAGTAAAAYVGFVGDEGEDGVRRAYPPATLERLAEVKRRYDPDNLFRLNVNVRPAVR